jgi:hypothetical protein
MYFFFQFNSQNLQTIGTDTVSTIILSRRSPLIVNNNMDDTCIKLKPDNTDMFSMLVCLKQGIQLNYFIEQSACKYTFNIQRDFTQENSLILTALTEDPLLF